MSRSKNKRPQTRFAHIPGLGPAGKTCGDCEHRQWQPVPVCTEAARMGGLEPSDCQFVPGHTSACKYFTPVTETTR